jgi:hypothetical protein
MDARSFTRRWLVTLAVLAASILGFPLLSALTGVIRCAEIDGSCEALVFLLILAGRVLAIAAIGIYLAWIAGKRSSGRDLFPWTFTFVLLNYLASCAYLFFPNYVVMNFEFGLPIVSPPALALGFLFTALIGLSCLQSHEATEAEETPRRVSLAIGACVLFLTAPQWLHALLAQPGLASLGHTAITALPAVLSPIYGAAGGHIVTILLVAFIASVAWWVAASRHAAVQESALD